MRKLTRRQRNRRPSVSTPSMAAEALERRALLTALKSAPMDFEAVEVSQFGGGDAVVINEEHFLGASFDTGNQKFGGYIDTFGAKTGAAGDIRLKGRAGFEVGFFLNSGSVDADFDDVQVMQSFSDPLESDPEVVITTEQMMQSGSFDTISPTLGAYTDLVLELGGHVNLNAKVLDTGSGITVGGPFQAADIDQELFSFNRGNNRQVRVLGQSIEPDFELKMSTPVSKAPPVSLELVASPIEGQIGMTETMNVVFGDILNRPRVEQRDKGNKYPELDAGVEVATWSQSIPHIDGLGDASLDAADRLHAKSELNADTLIADMNVQVGGLINPAFNKFNLSAGPASLTVTPLSYTVGPALHAFQSVDVVPTSTLTYEFDRPVKVQLGEQILDWDDVEAVSTVEFAVGTEVRVKFDAEPITVNPTWNFEAEMTNRIGVDVSMFGKLTVGELEFDLDLPGGIQDALGLPASLGPLYTETTRFTGTELDIYNETFSILSESTKLAPFVIGGDTEPSLQVEAFDETSGNSLRRAVRSANDIDAEEGANGADTENVIYLGAGTYDLFTDSGSSDDLFGDLDVTDRNLRIVGVGRHETIINANQIDRVFQVHNGASLTLENLSVTGGKVDNNDGGAIVNSENLRLVNVSVHGNEARFFGGGIANRGTLVIEDSMVSGNFAERNGGGIYNTSLGTVDVIRTQLDDNTANEQGGGIYSWNGEVTFDRSTVSRNTAAQSGGGAFVRTGTALHFVSSTITSNTAAAGGGIYTFDQASVTIDHSTITANTGSSFAGGVRIDGDGGMAISNSIIAGNFATDNRYQKWKDGRASGNLIIDNGHNLIGRTDTAEFAFSSNNGNKLNVNAHLSDLGRHGGPTETHILKPSSPAIDAGDPNSTPVDQRDFPTGSGAPDIGATQYFSDANVETSSDGDGFTLRAVINVFNAVGGTHTITLGPGTYELTDIRDGDLDIRNSTLSIVGAGAGQTIIDASAIDDRVFQIESSGSLHLEGLTVTGGSLTDTGNQNGAGISNAGTLTLDRVEVTGNFTDWRGGGIFNRGTLAIDASSISDNHAGRAGGGIYDETSSTMTVSNSTVSANVVADTRNKRNGSTPREAEGGGIYLQNGSATFVNSTISGNRAVGLDTPGESNGLAEGGGIFSWNANLEIQDSTIFDNTAATGVFSQADDTELSEEDSKGGGLFIERSDGKTVRLTNTILAGNSAAEGLEIHENVSSSFTSGGHNLIGNVGDLDDPDGDFIASDVVGDWLVPIDPKLGPLSDNGGPTLTHEPLANSPAVDVGSTSSTVDQRGLFRPIGSGDDVGSIESPVIFVDIPERETGDEDHAISEDGLGVRSLRQAIIDANIVPGADELHLPEGRYVLDIAGSGNADAASGDLDVLEDLTIIGSGVGRTIIDAGGLGDRAFDVVTGVTLKLQDLTLIGGSVAGGGSEGHGGSLRNIGGGIELLRTHIADGTAQKSGGNIWSVGDLTVVDSSITTGTAGQRGGSIAARTNVQIHQSTIAGSSAASGGGLTLDGAATTAVISASTIADNAATSEGGGVFIEDAHVDLAQTIVARNDAPGGPDVFGSIASSGHNLLSDSAGSSGTVSSDLRNMAAKLADVPTEAGMPVYLLMDGSPAIDVFSTSGSGTDQHGHPRQLGTKTDIGSVETIVSLISDTTDGLHSGSLRRAIEDANAIDGMQQINLAAGTFILDETALGDLDITDNLRIVGAGAGHTTIDASGLGDRAFDVLDETKLQLSGVTILGGSADVGGNIRNAGDLTLLGVAIGDGAAEFGGGIANRSEATLTVESSTLFNNTASDAGGGLHNLGDLLFSTSTLSGNTAHIGGGFRNVGTAEIVNATVAENHATKHAGGIANSTGSVALIANSIVANNTAPVQPDVRGVFISGVWQDATAPREGHNLIGDATGSTGFGQTGDQVGVDPQLGPLKNNGGNQVPSHALLPGSPALNAARRSWEWTFDDGDGEDVTQTKDAPTIDLRGHSRDQSGVDIGAEEMQFDLTVEVTADAEVTLRDLGNGLSILDYTDPDLVDFVFAHPVDSLTVTPFDDDELTQETYRLEPLSADYEVTFDMDGSGDRVELLPGAALNTPGGLRVSGDDTIGGSGELESLEVDGGAMLQPTNAGPLTITTGPVIIDDAVLDVSRLTNLGDQFTVIDNQTTTAVDGTFADLPEGGEISIAGHNYNISYLGGDGNDVVLTRGDDRFVLEDGLLTIAATEQADHVVIRKAADQLKIDATFAGTTTQRFFDFDSVDGIFIDGLGGDDFLSMVKTVTQSTTLLGGAGNDTLRGAGGNDLYEGGPGNDSLLGGGGDDSLHGDAGNDTLRGDRGHDLITNSSGNSTISGGTENDTVITGSGVDFIITHGGNDQVDSGGGDDDVRTGGGDDTIVTGAGNDFVSSGSQKDHVDSGPGDDHVRGGHQGDLIITGTGNDSIVAGRGSDTVLAGSGNDTIKGNDGDDVLVGGSGNDILGGNRDQDVSIGGAGVDTLLSGGSEDIVIGGATAFDNDTVALNALLQEWITGRSYANRVANLRDGSGTAVRKNGDHFLAANETVLDDGVADTLKGEAHQDWYFAKLGNGAAADVVFALEQEELLDELF